MSKFIKGTHLLSRILFNILAILFGLTLLVSVVAKGLESFLTVNLFGGYKTETITVDETAEELSYYTSKWDSVAQVRAANGNIGTAAVSEGSVLLENNGALPLEKGTTVSLFGATAYAPVYGIGGAGHISIDSEDRILFRPVLEDAGLKVNETLANWYQTTVDAYDTRNWRYDIAEGITNRKKPNMPYLNEENWSSVSSHLGTDKGDTAIFVIGRLGVEDLPGDLSFVDGSVSDSDTYANGDYLQLNQNEVSVLKNLRNEFKNVVLVINSPEPLELKILETDAYKVDAVLWTATLGATGIWGIGDILNGTVTPSGRLGDQWYKDNAYNPVLTNWATESVVYQEGEYLGYRYTETRYEDYVLGKNKAGAFAYDDVVKYPFGYGKSYTDFSYKLDGVKYYDKITAEEWKGHSVDYTDVYEVSVTVTNEGDYAGKEVVQVYLQQPYTAYDAAHGVEKPSVELVGYAKTSKLAKDASEQVKIYVPRAYFASFDREMKHTVDGKELTGTYLLEAGDYYLTVAKNAHQAVNNILKAKGVSAEQSARMTGMEGDANLVYSDFAITEDDPNTYGVSMNTGYRIETIFDNGDPRYVAAGNNVTFMTRSDWEGTVKLQYNSTYSAETGLFTRTKNSAVSPETVTNRGTVTPAVEDVIKDNGLEKDAYPTYGKNHEQSDAGHLNLINLRVRLNPATNAYEEIPYDDPLWDQLLDQLTWAEIKDLLSEGRRMTRPITSITKPETIDHNGNNGFSQRYNEGVASQSLAQQINDDDAGEYMTGFPCEGVLASTFNNRLVYTVGEAIGEDSLWSGEAGIYGFGLNMHRSPYHARYAEYYSEDPVLTGITAGYETAGAASMGVMVYNKHLVLNEQETNRSAAYTWVYESALREVYLRPFEIACRIADGKMNVMTAFNRLGAIWSGNNYNLCTTFLRKEAGMLGFAVTDFYKNVGMNMVPGVLCGQDLPDGTEKTEFDPFAPTAATSNESGPAVAWAMRESAHRILYMVVHSNAMNGIGTGTKIIVYEPEWIGQLQMIVQGVTIAFIASAVFVGVMSVCAIGVRASERKKERSGASRT